MSREIQLTQGQVAKVCDCHFHLVEGYKWWAHWDPHTQSYYATRHASLVERMSGNAAKILMHIVINGTPKGFVTDHKDRDTLNNQCSNLRTATRAENQHNRKLPKDNKSGFKGVCWNKNRKRWQASIKHNGKTEFLGLFTDIEDAARAYDDAAKELHGEFARTNF